MDRDIKKLKKIRIVFGICLILGFVYVVYPVHQSTTRGFSYGEEIVSHYGNFYSIKLMYNYKQEDCDPSQNNGAICLIVPTEPSVTVKLFEITVYDKRYSVWA